MSRVANHVMESKLDLIRSRYVASLDMTIIELDVLLNAIGSADSDRALEAIRSRVHKIAGVAPMLGFSGVGELARQIELALGDRSTSFDPRKAAMVSDRLEQLLNELESCLESDQDR